MQRCWHVHGTEPWNLLSAQVCKAAPQLVFLSVAHDVCKLAEVCTILEGPKVPTFGTDEEREIDPYDTTPNEASTEVPELDRERKKDNTLNMSSMTEEPNITQNHDGNITEATPRRRQGDILICALCALYEYAVLTRTSGSMLPVCRNFS